MRGRLIAWGVLALAASLPARAQPGQSEAAPTNSPAAAAAVNCECLVVPALKIVDIEIVQPVSSATAKAGDTFPIRLSAPIFVDGRIAIAAGAVGLGEVIHAQKKGMGGGGGELLLAARYLEVDGQRLRLRSFRAGRHGTNQTSTAIVTSTVFGPLGYAITGKDAAFAAGSVAEAKIAEPFTLRLAAVPPQPAATRPAAVPVEPAFPPDNSKENRP